MCVCVCMCVCVSGLESVPAVPCYRRCHQMSVLPENEKIIKLDQGDEEGWVDTHHGIGEGEGGGWRVAKLL